MRPARRALREHLLQALAQLNDTWAADVAVPFSLSAGDEVQGVVPAGPSAFAMVRRLRWALRRLPLRPAVRLRVGVGWGAVDTPALGLRSWEMDGPAFHHARAALEAARAAGGEATRFACGDPGYEGWVNVTLSLVDALMGRWTLRQWQAVDAYERLGSYAAAAAELGVALQNVQKRCAAARWPVIREAERWLGQSLDSPSRR